MKNEEYVRREIEGIKEQLREGVTLGGPGYSLNGVHYAPNEVRHTIVLSRSEMDNRIYYKVSHSEKHTDNNREIGDGWPKPVIASFVTEKWRGVYHCTIYSWAPNENLGISLTKKGAEKKIKREAENLATLISEETGIPIVRE